MNADNRGCCSADRIGQGFAGVLDRLRGSGLGEHSSESVNLLVLRQNNGEEKTGNGRPTDELKELFHNISRRIRPLWLSLLPYTPESGAWRRRSAESAPIMRVINSGVKVKSNVGKA